MAESDPQPTDAGTQETDDTLTVGTIFDGKYEIVGFVGKGGMARVYEARHVKTGQVLAVKVLSQEEDPKLARIYERRFMREATIATSLMHPNVVPVHDFGVAEPSNQRFIAMDLLRGHDLATELKDHGPMQPARALRLVSECLDALATGHRRGIVHKDLKPANLFVTSPGTDEEALVILDYGVATIDAIQITRLTEMGTFAGTPQYLPPEYILDQKVAPSLDVYQMGLILVEMLNGRAVLHGKNAYACIRIHCEGSLEFPPDLIEGPLGPAIKRATALDPQHRFQDAAEFKAALTGVEAAAVAETFSPAPRDGDALGSLPTAVVTMGDDTGTQETATVASPRLEPNPQATAPTIAYGAPVPAPSPEKTAGDPADRRVVTLVLVGVLLVVTCLAVLAWTRWSAREHPVPPAPPVSRSTGGG